MFINGDEVKYESQDVMSCDTQLDTAGASLVIGNRETAPLRGFHGLLVYARLAGPATQVSEWNTGTFGR